MAIGLLTHDQYSLLLDAVRESADPNIARDRKLEKLLLDAMSDYPAGFDANADLVAKAYCALEQSQYSAQPTAVEIMSALQAKARQSTWAKETLISSGMWAEATVYTDQIGGRAEAATAATEAPRSIAEVFVFGDTLGPALSGLDGVFAGLKSSFPAVFRDANATSATPIVIRSDVLTSDHFALLLKAVQESRDPTIMNYTSLHSTLAQAAKGQSAAFTTANDGTNYDGIAYAYIALETSPYANTPDGKHILETLRFDVSLSTVYPRYMADGGADAYKAALVEAATPEIPDAVIGQAAGAETTAVQPERSTGLSLDEAVKAYNAGEFGTSYAAARALNALSRDVSSENFLAAIGIDLAAVESSVRRYASRGEADVEDPMREIETYVRQRIGHNPTEEELNAALDPTGPMFKEMSQLLGGRSESLTYIFTKLSEGQLKRDAARTEEDQREEREALKGKIKG